MGKRKHKTSYCGCCGEPTGNQWFCDRCKDHVLKHGPMEERTYVAQFGKECPYSDLY